MHRELSDFLKVTVIMSGEAKTGIHSRQADSVIKALRARQLGRKHMSRGVEWGQMIKEGKEIWILSYWQWGGGGAGTNGLSRVKNQCGTGQRVSFRELGHEGVCWEIAIFFTLMCGLGCSFHLGDHHLP